MARSPTDVKAVMTLIEVASEPFRTPGAPGWIIFENRDDQPWVIMRGEIDFAVAGQVSDLTIQTRHRPGRPFTVDMGSVTFLDSAGVALLMRLHSLERKVTLINVPARVRRLFAIMNLTSVFVLEHATGHNATA